MILCVVRHDAVLHWVITLLLRVVLLLQHKLLLLVQVELLLVDVRLVIELLLHLNVHVDRLLHSVHFSAVNALVLVELGASHALTILQQAVLTEVSLANAYDLMVELSAFEFNVVS